MATRYIIREIGVITRVAIAPEPGGNFVRYPRMILRRRRKAPAVVYRASVAVPSRRFPPRAQEFSPRLEEMRYDRDS